MVVLVRQLTRRKVSALLDGWQARFPLRFLPLRILRDTFKPAFTVHRLAEGSPRWSDTGGGQTRWGGGKYCAESTHWAGSMACCVIFSLS